VVSDTVEGVRHLSRPDGYEILTEKLRFTVVP
jgi:hypothetical protein